MKIIKMIAKGEIEKYGQNTYLVVKASDAILIDASVSPNEIQKNLMMFSPKPKLKAIFLTHAHFDHIFYLKDLAENFECPVFINKFSKDILKNKNKNLSILLDNPFEIKDLYFKEFSDGDEMTIGDIGIKCYLTPGHSLDSSVFVVEDNMFTGDTVFKNSIGRIDLVGGDKSKLEISLERIKNELSMDIDTFYPGHDENFTKENLDSVVDYYC